MAVGLGFDVRECFLSFECSADVPSFVPNCPKKAPAKLPLLGLEPTLS